MDKKSALQILEFANEELQGKMKNLVWCDSEQKNISIAVPESYEFSEADAVGRSIRAVAQGSGESVTEFMI